MILRASDTRLSMVRLGFARLVCLGFRAISVLDRRQRRRGGARVEQQRTEGEKHRDPALRGERKTPPRRTVADKDTSTSPPSWRIWPDAQTTVPYTFPRTAQALSKVSAIRRALASQNSSHPRGRRVR